MRALLAPGSTALQAYERPAGPPAERLRFGLWENTKEGRFAGHGQAPVLALLRYPHLLDVCVLDRRELWRGDWLDVEPE